MRFLWDNFRSYSFDFQDENVYEENKVFVRYISLFIFSCFLFTVITLFWEIFFPRQVVIEKANPQKVKPSVTVPRGSIYDKAGRAIAHSVYLAGLYCSPRDIAGGEKPESERYSKNREEFARKVASAFNLDYEYVLKRMTMQGSDGSYLRDSVIVKSLKDIEPHEIEIMVNELNKWYMEQTNPRKSQSSNEQFEKKENQFLNSLARNFQKARERVRSLLLNNSSDGKMKDEAMAGPPLFIRYRWVREYPHKEIAGNIVGFASLESVGGSLQFVGKDGIEHDWDGYLSGNSMKNVGIGTYVTQANSTSNSSSPTFLVGNLYLTIDMNIQACLERELDKRIEECNAEDGMGIILDPYTGAIMAMASRPSYDPNLPETRVGSAIKNKVIVDRFEPGSTLKIVTASACLELKKVNFETPLDCEKGAYRVGKKLIRDVHGMGVVPFWKCFEQSSNVAFVKLGMTLGLDTLREYVKKFGFGMKTSGDFRYEQIGAISTNNALTTLSSMSIGYAVAVTTLQLARAYSVIANGGYLVEPYIVEKVVDQSGRVVYQHQIKRQQVISEDTTEKVKILCHQVVLKGTGKYALIPEYKVGGKTGTAHLAKPIKQGGNYDESKVISLFAGFGPLKNPRIVAVIVIRYPQSKVRFGGYVCGPVFKNVVRYTLTYLNVPPEPVDLEDVKKNDAFLAEDSYEEENEDINFAEFEHIVIPDSVDKESYGISYATNLVYKQADVKNNSNFGVSENNKVDPILVSYAMSEPDISRIVSQSKVTNSMPDLVGLTKLQALEILDNLGIGYECNGYGRVASQYPPPGSSLDGVSICLLNFSKSLSEVLTKN